jgi:hypothetical protein
MDTYKHLTCGPLTEAQKKKVLRTGKITFTAAQVSGTGKTVCLHPENAKRWSKAKAANKGLSITFTPGEVAASLAMDGDALEGSGMDGGSLWSWMKEKAWPWLKKNYDVIKPVLSRVADTAIPAAATYLGQPALAVPARGALKQLTGVGVSKKLGKGTPEMAARMQKLRSMRKTGGSFRLS